MHIHLPYYYYFYSMGKTVMLLHIELKDFELVLIILLNSLSFKFWCDAEFWKKKLKGSYEI